MQRILVVTGSGSGIGQATAARLLAKGHRVIGVDLKDADVNVDLSTRQGREDLVLQVRALAPDGIDGVLTSAGLASFERPIQTLAVNYFGTIATLQGLHPLLRGPGARCVAVASTALLQDNDEVSEIEELCLQGHEDAALELAGKYGFLCAYPASKRALTRWARHAATTPEWAGAGKVLNVVAPGVVKTPMITQALANPDQAAIIKKTSPIAVDDFAQPAEVAELMDFLLSATTSYIVGQVLFVDGGSEALVRPDTL